MTHDSRPMRQIHRRGHFIVLIAVLATVAGFFVFGRDAEESVVFTNVVSPGMGLVAAAILWVAGRDSDATSPRLGRAWRVLSSSVLLLALGDATWTLLESVLELPPFPSIADVFYLSFAPVFLAGVLVLTDRPATSGERFSSALDLGTILAAASLGFWNFLLGPTLVANAGSSFFEQMVLLAYPATDLVLLGALILLVYRLRDDQAIMPLGMLAAALTVMIVADAIFGRQSILGTYVSGGLLDYGWVASNVLMGLAGLTQSDATRSRSNPVDGRRRQRVQRVLKVVRNTLPYFWIMLAYGLIVAGGTQQLPMGFDSLSWSAGGLIGLVVLRQLIMLAENERLQAGLRTQAAELERTNVSIGVEIRERRRIQAKLSHAAMHDGLTGLANRSLFLEQVEEAIRRGKADADYSFAVLFIDVDYFKVVNDSLGHLTGDELLVAMANRLRSTLRANDTIGRFGGDEFQVLLDNIRDEATVRMLAGRIQRSMQRPYTLQGRDVTMSSSIGCVTTVRGYDRAEDLLRDADLALYKAKELGKARLEIFDVEMRNQALERLEMEQDLRAALKGGEFRLQYQPILSLASDQEVMGWEALVRWMHPRKGLLLPGVFLNVAEENGLSVALGDWVMHQACRQMGAWQEQNPALERTSVHINLTTRQFYDPHLVERATAAARAGGLKPERLKLEITEKTLIVNPRSAEAAISKLRAAGIQVQIDHYGTGDSAFAALQRLPIEAIKIDRFFIQNMGHDQKAYGLVRAIISMAREMGMTTVAEGIETPEQLRDLKSLSCGEGQGFLLSAPVDAEAVPGFLVGVKQADTEPRAQVEAAPIRRP